MGYDLTNVTNSTEISTFIIELNTVSNKWILSATLIVMFVLIILVISQMGYDMATAFFSASISAVFIGAIMLYFGGIGVTLFSIFMGICILSFFVFALGGR